MQIQANNIQQNYNRGAMGAHPGLGQHQAQTQHPSLNGATDQANVSNEAHDQGPRNLKMEAQLQLMMLSMMSPDEQDAHIDRLEQEDPPLAKAVMEAIEDGGLDEMGQPQQPAAPEKAAPHEAAPEQGAAPAEAAGAAEAAPAGGEEKGPEIKLPDAPEGFLWKPKSESDGKLVMLLPKGMNAKSIDIMSPDGKTKLSSVSRGGNQGKVANGGREHYRFGKSGAGYPPNSRVRINTTDGKSREIKIPKPSIRNAGGGKKG
jgi:hypothetical protein